MPQAQRRARFQDDDEEVEEEEDEEPDGHAADAEQSAAKKKKRNEDWKCSERFKGHKTIVPYHNPYPKPPEGTVLSEAEEKERKKKSRAWTKSVHEQTDYLVDATNARDGVQARLVNRLILKMTDQHPGFIEQLRSLGALQREHHVAKREVARQLEQFVFTDDATVDMLYDERHSLSTRQLEMLRSRYNHVRMPDGSVGRIVLSSPPQPNAKRDPDAVSFESNAKMAIVDEPNLLPFIFKHAKEAKRKADALLASEDFYMPPETKDEDGTSLGYSFEGCARPTLQLIGNVIDKAEKHGIRLPLKRGRAFQEESDDESGLLVKRHRVQIICDAFKWNSEKEATRIVTRLMDLDMLFNHHIYSNDLCFSFTGDKAEEMRNNSMMGGEHGLAETIEKGLVVKQVDVVPRNVRNTPFEPFAEVMTEVEIDVPVASGGTLPGIMLTGGDASAASSASNLNGPTDYFYACDQCTVAKADQGNSVKVRMAPRRNLANTLALAHINPFDQSIFGKRCRDIQADSCVCPSAKCGKTIDAALTAAEAREYEDADEQGKYAIQLRHRKSHFGVLRGRRPWLMIENRRRVPSALHFTMNGVGNTKVCTFDKVPYDLRGGKECHKRMYANLHILRPARIKHRFRTKPPKKSQKPARPPQGPCARKLLCGPVLEKLIKCFYPGEVMSAQQRDDLAGASARVQATAGAQAEEVRRARAAGPSRAARSRTAPTAGEQPAERAAAISAAVAAADDSDDDECDGVASLDDVLRRIKKQDGTELTPRRVYSGVSDKEQVKELMELVDTTMGARKPTGAVKTQLRNMLKHITTRVIMLIDDEDGAIKSFAAYQLKVIEGGDQMAYLRELHVHGELQGKGIGSALESEVETDCAKEDEQVLRLTVQLRGERTNYAFKWYRDKFGYIEIYRDEQEAIMELDLSRRGGATSSGSDATAGTTDGETDGEAEEEEERDDARARMEVLPEGTKTKGLSSVVHCWFTLSMFIAHMYEKYDDRSEAENARHGKEGQARGGKWADALSFQTENNADWYYPHKAKFHCACACTTRMCL